jgi:hypothetical protein
MKALAFNTLNYPLYQNYINQITQDSICIYSQEILCSLLHEKVYGNVETKDTMLRQISFYYLSFYYQDKFLAIDTEEKDYVTAKYKFDKIGSCMRKLGIIPTDPLYMTTTTSTTSTTTSTSTTSTSTTTLSPCLLAGTASVVIVDPCLITGTASLSTTTTSSTTSTVCTRPTGLINKTFLYSYNFNSGPSVNFTATQELACAAAQNVSNPSYSFNGSTNQMSSFTVGATSYAGIATNCLKTPDGYYISNLSTKEVVHIVSGVIVSIEICNPPTTTTSTSSTTTSSTTSSTTTTTTTVAPPVPESVDIFNINALNVTGIDAVRLDGDIISLDSLYAYPIEGGYPTLGEGYAHGNYIRPEIPGSTLVVEFTSTQEAPVTLVISGSPTITRCENSVNGYVEFTSLDLSAGPAISITLGVEGTVCPS